MARAHVDLHHSPNSIFDHVFKKYELEKILTTEISIYPPLFNSMNINLDLHQLPKKSSCPIHFRNLFEEILSSTLQHTFIFTDASVTENHAGMAIVHEDTQTQWKLSNKCPIYTAEALATLKAIEFVTHNTEISQAIILSDFLSSLISLQNQWKSTDITRKIQNTYIRATLAGQHISYMWIPGQQATSAQTRLPNLPIHQITPSQHLTSPTKTLKES